MRGEAPVAKVTPVAEVQVVQGVVVAGGQEPAVREQPLPVGHIVVVQPAVPYGYEAFHAPISTTRPLQWPFAMNFSVCTSCALDPGLCCYSLLCTCCLRAELAEMIGTRGIWGSEKCCDQWLSAFTSSLCLDVLGMVFFCGLGWICSPWIWSGWCALSRDSLKEMYKLRHDEFCGSTVTSFLPWSYCFFANCSVCATYQEAYLIKHTLKRDFNCSFYRSCCSSTPIQNEPLPEGVAPLRQPLV